MVMDLGSDVDHCGILTAIVQVVSNEITGLVGLQTKNLACTGQQLIPGLLSTVGCTVYLGHRLNRPDP